MLVCRCQMQYEPMGAEDEAVDLHLNVPKKLTQLHDSCLCGCFV